MGKRQTGAVLLQSGNVVSRRTSGVRAINQTTEEQNKNRMLFGRRKNVESAVTFRLLSLEVWDVVNHRRKFRPLRPWQKVSQKCPSASQRESGEA